MGHSEKQATDLLKFGPELKDVLILKISCPNGLNKVTKESFSEGDCKNTSDKMV